MGKETTCIHILVVQLNLLCVLVHFLYSDYTMVNFVKPNLLGTHKEFKNRFVNPIINGQCRDSSPEDIRMMRLRAHILFSVLKDTVQVTIVIIYTFSWLFLLQSPYHFTFHTSLSSMFPFDRILPVN